MIYTLQGGHPLEPPFQRGSTPLDTPKGEKEWWLLIGKGGEAKTGLKGGRASLSYHSPSPLKERGIKGVR